MHVRLDVLATGYPSLDYIFQVSRTPAADETAIVERLPDGYTYGGCGANVGVGLARLGLRAGVAMVVGDDDAGRAYVRYLEDQGVDTTDVLVWPETRTSQSRLFRNPEGGYQNFFFPGAADAWEGPLQLGALERARAALLTVGAPHYNREFVDRVLAAGVPLIWQLKADVYSYPPAQVERLTRASTILFMNTSEARYLREVTGITDERDLLDRHAEVVVVTAGMQGSRIHTHAGTEKIPVVPPESTVDTTGAGDAYTAGFLAGRFHGFDAVICGRLAATAASFVVETVGCQTNLPTWERLASRYERHFGERPSRPNAEEQS